MLRRRTVFLLALLVVAATAVAAIVAWSLQPRTMEAVVAKRGRPIALASAWRHESGTADKMASLHPMKVRSVFDVATVKGPVVFVYCDDSTVQLHFRTTADEWLHGNPRCQLRALSAFDRARLRLIEFDEQGRLVSEERVWAPLLHLHHHE